MTTSGKTTVTIDLSNYVKADNASKAGQKILVTYSATLNEDAFVGTPDQNNPGNLNSAKVQYSNGPSEDSIGESTPSETHSYTFNFNLKKIYKEGDHRTRPRRREVPAARLRQDLRHLSRQEERQRVSSGHDRRYGQGH